MATAMRLGRLIKKFLDWCEKVRAPKTTVNYRIYLHKFLKHVGNKPITKLKAVDLSIWAVKWHDVQSVQRLFNFAVDELEIIRKNPFSKVQRPKAKMRTRIFTRREEIVFLRRAKPVYRQFLIALRGTMARPGEMASVTWPMLTAPLDWPGTIEEALAAGVAMFVIWDGFKAQDRMDDPYKPRILMMTRRVQRLILRMRGQAKSLDGPVFHNLSGGPMTRNAVHCHFRRMRERFPEIRFVKGQPLVLYSFRHTGATMASPKVSQKVLAELLGHRSVATTERYQHLQVEQLQEGMEAIQDMTKILAKREERKNAARAEREKNKPSDAVSPNVENVTP